MRWSSRKSGIVLALVLAAGVGGIVWDFLARRARVGPGPQADLLPPQVTRQATGFEHFEYKFGDTVFSVQANTSMEMVGGVHALREVSLTRYSESGEPSELVFSREALYRLDEKDIEFSGDVQIRLADGTRVYSHKVRADLERELVRIEDRFDFESGDLRGRGESLLYRIRDRELEIEGDFQVEVPAAQGPARAQARGAHYWLAEGRLDLIDAARITEPDRRLEAGLIRVFMTPEGRVERLLSSDRARLLVYPDQTFTGERINLFFEPETGQLRSFEVLGRHADGGPMGLSKAIYRKGEDGREHYLEALRITATPASTAEGEGAVALRRFSAREEVLFRFPRAGIQEAVAQDLSGLLFEGGDSLERLEFQGGVRIVRAAPDSEGIERLRSRNLTVDFLPGQVLERVEARSDVEVETELEGERRRLLARERVEVFYLDGQPHRAVAERDCVLELRGESGPTWLRAPRIDAHYENGLPAWVLAGEGVVLEWPGEEEARRSTSRRLEVFYREGRMTEAVQSGEFHYQQQGPQSRLELRSEEARYDPETDRITVSGRALSSLLLETAEPEGGRSDTQARRIILERESGRIEALGQVQTVAQDSGDPTVITGGRMEADPDSGWVNYSENPRIIKGENSIRGRRVRLNVQQERLVVEDEVASSLVGKSGDDKRSYSVSAGRLEYEQDPPRARYEGNVVLKSEGLVLEASSLDIRFQASDPEQVEEIVARGDVVLTQEGRRALGQRAVYEPGEEKVVLTGEDAEYSDPRGVRTSGRFLTFYLNDERLSVEGLGAPKQP